MVRHTLDIGCAQTGILNKHVLAALSGGADSVALVHLLNEARLRGEIRLTLAHFEHGIRGEESKGDQAFVIALSKRLNLPLITESGNVPEEAARTGEGLESCARRLRHAFLNRAKEQSGADVIATAHHKLDQAETVLMHILRGGGLTGAKGMSQMDGHYVRPLLRYAKEELIQYLLSIGESWREDSTNLLSDNPRNLLRLEAMPVLQRAYPGAIDAINRFSDIARGEDDYMEKAAQTAFLRSTENFLGVWSIKNAGAYHEAVIRRVIKKIAPDFGFDEIEKIRLCTSRASLPFGWQAQRIKDTIYLSPPLEKPAPAALSIDQKTLLPGICEILPVSEGDQKSEFCAIERINPLPLIGACLRTREDGDFIRPLGMGGRKKLLSDVMTDRKIPRPYRDRLPVIAKGSEVFWLTGHMISDAIKVDETTKQIIKLKAMLYHEYGGETK